MDIEKLKELKAEFEQVRKYNDRHCMSTVTEDDVIEVLDEAIARQSETEMAVCPDCNGSGVYQEYDEYDRYYVHACGTCEGTGEAARQSVKSEDVQEAIEFMKKEVKMLENWIDRTGDCFDKNLAMFKTILTALQAYEPKEPCERASLVASGSVYQVLTCSNCGAVLDEIKFTEPPKGE